MSDKNWAINALRLADLNKELSAIERAEKRARLKKWLCNLGIGVVWACVVAAILLLDVSHITNRLQKLAATADKQLVLDDGKTVLVVPAPGHGEPFTFPTLKKYR